MIGYPTLILAAALPSSRRSVPSLPASEGQPYVISENWAREEYCNLTVLIRVALPELLTGPEKSLLARLFGPRLLGALQRLPPRPRPGPGPGSH